MKPGPISLPKTERRHMFKDKTLLITGGTGSFGNAVLKRFINSDLAEIRIFSRDEKKQEDMRLAFGNDKIKFYIGDVREADSIDYAMNGVDYIYHAAALKQVPSCEFYPMEAYKTNVIGTENVIQSSIRNRVERVVLLSTDKAVYPINAMGISKAMAEKVLVGKSRMLKPTDTILCATRYGNVMASRGSVIPLFVDQIRRGQPLTITDAAMTRFLMSLDESVDLVLHAFEHARQGDIFVQKAPATKVGDLAEALKRIFKSDTPIRTIGTRHGEKLYETLISREEMAKVEDLGRYYRIPADARDLNYNKYFSDGEQSIAVLEDYTSHNTKRLDVEQTMRLLNNLDYIKDVQSA
nr:polysaccharide biosynthesis protein [Donghicola eburneus]